MSNRTFYFHIDIYYTIFKQYYMFPEAQILVTCENDQRIKLAAHYLRPFITHEGIRGRFRITLDSKNKITDLKKIK